MPFAGHFSVCLRHDWHLVLEAVFPIDREAEETKVEILRLLHVEDAKDGIVFWNSTDIGDSDHIGEQTSTKNPLMSRTYPTV